MSSDPPLPSISYFAPYSLPVLSRQSTPTMDVAEEGEAVLPKGDPLQMLEEAASKGDTEDTKAVATTTDGLGHVDEQGRSALSILVEKRCPGALEALLQKLGSEETEDLLKRNRLVGNVPWPLLHRAIHGGDSKVVQVLLEAQANIKATGGTGVQGQTPLAYAINQHANEDVLKCLFAHQNPAVVGYWDPLILAAKRGNLVCAKALWEAEEWKAGLLSRKSAWGKGSLTDDLEVGNVRRITPLHLAARLSFLPLVEFFLGLKADVHKTDSNECTPLHIAAGFKYQKKEESHTNEVTSADHAVIEALLQRVDEQRWESLKDVRQWTPLHHAACVGDADLDVLEQLQTADKERGFTWLRAVDKYGCLPLHLAARAGHVKAVKSLLGEGGDVKVKVEDGEQQTCMHLAAANGHLDVVRYLVMERKAKKHERDCQDKMPAQLAYDNGHLNVVQFLLGRSNDPTPEDEDPLHLAAKNNHPRMLHFLLTLWQRHKRDIPSGLEKPDSQSRTALHLAANEGHREVVSVLLEYSAQFNKRDKDSLTAMHLAAQAGSLSVVKELLRKKAELHPETGHEEEVGGKKCKVTPLYLAVKGGRAEVVKALISESKRENIEDPFTLALAQKKMSIIPAFVGARMSMTRKDVRSLLQQESPYIGKVFDSMSIPIRELEQFKGVRNVWEHSSTDDRGGLAFVSGLLRWVRLREGPEGSASDVHNKRFINSVKGPTCLQALLEDARLVPCSLEVVTACPLQDLTSVDVMEALAKAPNQDVLRSDTAYAIITAAWERVWIQFWWDLLFKVGVAGVLTWVCYQVREKEQPLSLASTVLLSVKVGLKFLDELSEIVRLCRQERVGQQWWQSKTYQCFQYLFSLGTAVDWCMMALDGGTVFVLQRLIKPPYEDIWPRSILGVCVAANWLVLLYATRGFESFGPRLLPILYAVRDTRPFFLVVGLCVVAATSAFYVLGGDRDDTPATFYTAYVYTVQLGLYGDFDLSALEKFTSIDYGDDFTIEGIKASQIFWYVVGISINVVLINLLIAVLSNSYDRHEELSRVTFLQHRAYMYVNMRAGFLPWLLQSIANMFQRLCPCWRRASPKEFLGIIRREDCNPDEERSTRALVRRVDERIGDVSQQMIRLAERLQRLEAQSTEGRLIREMHEFLISQPRREVTAPRPTAPTGDAPTAEGTTTAVHAAMGPASGPTPSALPGLTTWRSTAGQ